MSEPKIFTPEEEIERARQARSVIDNEIYKEACERIEQGLAAHRQRVPMNATDSHTRLILMEQLWMQLKDYIQQVADTGQFAQFEIDQREAREKTLLERILTGSFRN